MSRGQYIDYVLQGSNFDNKMANQPSYATKTFGGALTVNPYIRFKYDKISVDDFTPTGGNVLRTDDENTFSAKIGVNLFTNYGLYGGLAYSRGLSGSLDTYINGVAMPSDDNDTNVIYLNLGYKGNVNENTLFDVNFEKTFCDYDGWTMEGRVDFLL